MSLEILVRAAITNEILYRPEIMCSYAELDGDDCTHMRMHVSKTAVRYDSGGYPWHLKRVASLP